MWCLYNSLFLLYLMLVFNHYYCLIRLIGWKYIVSFAFFSHVNYVHVRISHFLTDKFVPFFLCQRLVTIKDVILRQLHDDDLTVVQAALSLDWFTEIISPLELLEALHHVLKRCLSFLTSGEHEVFGNLHCHHSCL